MVVFNRNLLFQGVYFQGQALSFREAPCSDFPPYPSYTRTCLVLVLYHEELHLQCVHNQPRGPRFSENDVTDLGMEIPGFFSRHPGKLTQHFQESCQGGGLNRCFSFLPRSLEKLHTTNRNPENHLNNKTSMTLDFKILNFPGVGVKHPQH